MVRLITSTLDLSICDPLAVRLNLESQGADTIDTLDALIKRPIRASRVSSVDRFQRKIAQSFARCFRFSRKFKKFNFSSEFDWWRARTAYQRGDRYMDEPAQTTESGAATETMKQVETKSKYLHSGVVSLWRRDTPLVWISEELSWHHCGTGLICHRQTHFLIKNGQF